MRSEYIPEDQLQRIRRSLNEGDRLILDMCIETGARIDEALCMRRYQIKGGRVLLNEWKTNKKRVCEISEDLQSRLGEKVKGKHVFSYVFDGQGRPEERAKVHRSTFWRHVKKVCKDLGLEQHTYTPHSLRKVYAVRLLRRTRSLEQVRKIMGHKYLSTTMIYALSDRADELGLY